MQKWEYCRLFNDAEWIEEDDLESVRTKFPNSRFSNEENGGWLRLTSRATYAGKAPDADTYYDDLEEALSQLGAEGWELVTVIHEKFNYDSMGTYFFKRPFEKEPQKRPSSKARAIPVGVGAKRPLGH
jgi:hypothetical protein